MNYLLLARGGALRSMITFYVFDNGLKSFLDTNVFPCKRVGVRGYLKAPPFVLVKHYVWCGQHYAWCGRHLPTSAVLQQRLKMA